MLLLALRVDHPEVPAELSQDDGAMTGVLIACSEVSLGLALPSQPCLADRFITLQCLGVSAPYVPQREDPMYDRVMADYAQQRLAWMTGAEDVLLRACAATLERHGRQWTA